MGCEIAELRSTPSQRSSGQSTDQPTFFKSLSRTCRNVKPSRTQPKWMETSHNRAIELDAGMRGPDAMLRVLRSGLKPFVMTCCAS